ncbi:hypothetical protein C0989_010734 [Termitomyces sp. Mn162]|nr:hypothetical protein C0989_010734 [Termitomyces sp. Mn162]
MAAQPTITEDTSAPNFEDCSPCSIESSATRVAPALVNPREDPHALTAEDLTVTPSLPRTDHAEMSTEVGSSTSEALVISNEKDFCKRVVFRRRPRASNGKSIFNKTLPGKTAPNDCMPYGTHLSSISTGSKLMNWMKAKGEADHAKDEIAWAEMEEDPKIIDPRSPCVKIQEMEKMIKLGKAGEYVLKQDTTENDIFNSCSPWSFVPFSYEMERLTSIIDLDHLVVHDPWNLLAARDEVEEQVERKGGEGNFSSPVEDRAEEVGPLDKGDALEAYLIHPPAILGPVEPPILVIHEPPPRPRTTVSKVRRSIEEAHLYLSPEYLIGRGNHSLVYQAELELPRAAVIAPPSTDHILCRECIARDIVRIIREEDGEHGESKDQKWKEKSGEVRLVPKSRSSSALQILYKSNEDEDQNETEDTAYYTEFVGPVRPVRTTVDWQDPMHPTCPHVKPLPKVPPTVKMRVIGKLSLQYDDHLVHEATNYQKFERHMFEYWSGLNVLPSMHNPVPVGPFSTEVLWFLCPRHRLRIRRKGRRREGRFIQCGVRQAG